MHNFSEGRHVIKHTLWQKVATSHKKVAASHMEQRSPLMILVLPRYEEMSEVGLIKLSENF